MITVNALLFPSSITNSLIAVGNDGLQERDRMVRACLATICELALKNPEVVAQRGGLSTILKNVIDCQLSRINEALITTILHLLNHPHTRHYVRSDVELEQILAPYTDFHYRHNPDTADGQLKEDREARFLASRMAIVASFRSWSGIINLCKSGNSGIVSLIGLLCIPNMDVRKGLLEVMYDIFRLPVPVVTRDFMEALLSVDPSRYQDSWRLSDGFVASEAKTILLHRARSRPDLMDNYLALVLCAFINNGLLEGLVEVITSSDDQISVRATILLGELLHMANTILPQSHSHHLHCLPTLMSMAASFDVGQEKRMRASVAVNHLKCFHERKKRGPRPSSLYLDHILRKSTASRCSTEQHPRASRDIFLIKDTEEALVMNLKDSQILNHKQNLDWNWVLISTILKWPNVNLRSNKDEQIHKFVRRLLYFYKPSSKLFTSLELDHSKARQLAVAGCQFIEFLLESDEEGQAYLEELLRDMVQWLSSCSGLKADRSLQNNGLLTTLSQHYFLFIGTMSAHPIGVKTLEKCGIFQCLLSLCSLKNQDLLLKLTITTLDYSRDGLARVILSKVLTASSDNCRLYATKQLRVLLRANVEFFSTWGIELLVTQLHDRNKAVSMEALDILDEACEDKANLHALIQLKPALTHLGDQGLLLLLRFLSIPKGFSYLNERGFITKQLEIWQKEYSLRYVDLIEEQLNEALTTYRKPVDGDNYVRRSNQRCQRPNVYLPVHLYGQLVHDKTGCHLLEIQNVVPDLSYTVRSPVLDSWEGIKQLKAALWALGNISSSTWGLNLLLEENVIPDIVALAQHCEVLSVRGTCLYVLGLISRTKQGCEVLKQQGWDAVRHSRRQAWPVVTDEMEPQPASELSSVPSTLSLNSESTGSRHNSESESTQPGLYILDDERFGSPEVPEDHPVLMRPKVLKERSPLALLAPGRLVRNSFLNVLSLPGKKQRSASDPKGSTGSRGPWESQLASLCRSRTLTEPSVYVPGQPDPFTFARGPELRETESRSPRGGGIAAQQEPGSRERLTGDGSSSSSSGGGAQFKSRSQSFNTDTTTSGVSSMSSSPSREAPGVDSSTGDTDCASLDTVGSTRTVRTPCSLTPQSDHLPLSKSSSASLVPPGSAHTLPRRAQSLKSPSVAAIRSLADCSFAYTSPRDALGYATLKRLQQQRIHPSLSHSEALASPAKDVLFTDAITMKAGSLDSRLTPRRAIILGPFGLALSFASLDKEELLSPISQTTLHRSSSVRSMVSSATYGCSDDYIGLALPMDVADMFQVRIPESPGGGRGCYTTPPLRQQLSITELMAASRADPQGGPGPEDSGLQEHHEDNCLYCVGVRVRGGHAHSRTGALTAPCPCSGVSGCSDTVSQGGASPGGQSQLIRGNQGPRDGPAYVRVTMVTVGFRQIPPPPRQPLTVTYRLCRIKEKFPYAFDDICLYSEVCHLLANCLFRLPSRRFIQELFQDVQFSLMYEEAEMILSTPPKKAGDEAVSDS
uniref:RPTOR independent companion of MTOR, complex 2b n=1 Tax=Paramormyrops kingsleyae TaxID=1676925 RepID=A0A3B3Q9J8_9TELE